MQHAGCAGGNMLKLDIDDYQHQPALKLIRLFHAVPLPFFVRKSSSGRGLHIKCPDLETWNFLRYIFDDLMRISLDEKREQVGLPVSNLLWDVKMGKEAGIWTYISTSADMERYLEGLMTETIYTQRAYRRVSRR